MLTVDLGLVDLLRLGEELAFVRGENLLDSLGVVDLLLEGSEHDEEVVDVTHGRFAPQLVGYADLELANHASLHHHWQVELILLSVFERVVEKSRNPREVPNGDILFVMSLSHRVILGSVRSYLV